MMQHGSGLKVKDVIDTAIEEDMVRMVAVSVKDPIETVGCNIQIDIRHVCFPPVSGQAGNNMIACIHVA